MFNLLRVHTNKHGMHIGHAGVFADTTAAMDFVNGTGLEIAGADSAWLLVPAGQVQQLCSPAPDGYCWENV